MEKAKTLIERAAEKIQKEKTGKILSRRGKKRRWGKVPSLAQHPLRGSLKSLRKAREGRGSQRGNHGNDH